MSTNFKYQVGEHVRIARTDRFAQQLHVGKRAKVLARRHNTDPLYGPLYNLMLLDSPCTILSLYEWKLEPEDIVIKVN